MQLTEINIYPVKSLGRVQLSQSSLTDRGLMHDRRWMIVDEHNQFITQRKIPSIAVIQPQLTDRELILSHPNGSSARVPLVSDGGEEINVQIFDQICLAISHQNHSTELNNWLSNILGLTCKLVYMPDQSHRFVKEKYGAADKIVSFADGFPYVIIGEASLNYLNQKLENPVPMTRFRPNFVFSGGEPHEEDKWSQIKIGTVHFRAVVQWGRCMVTTVDQNTGVKETEPLKTLNTYRKKDDKVVFGMTLIGPSSGIVSVGDLIEPLS
ncbi:MAG: MOSC domain-containing protein [Bacteroidetes bacterium]|nr:MOSC domain-containing protein [Bacteroidota bacterium]MCB0854556.1 MOSC domain-containing protein [Bacteroidota bacterium]